jgi:hypothetical protein
METLWKLLKPGGSLIVSLPCAAEPFEEYLNYDEYGLLERGADGYLFAQRFYDQELLKERIYSVTGSPAEIGIYGERESGCSLANRRQKNEDPDYPFWREPYLMGTRFSFFDTIGELPGWGVVTMEFRKPR